MILISHKPKTAGTAFRVYVQDNVGPRLAAYYQEIEHNHPAFRFEDCSDPDRLRRAAETSGAQIIQSHQIGPFLKAFPGAPVFCCIRDPLKRTISSYLHLQQKDSGQFSEMAFTTFVRGAGLPYTSLVQEARGAGSPLALFPYERIDEAIDTLNTGAGWKGRLQLRNLSTHAEEAKAAEILSRVSPEVTALLAPEQDIFDRLIADWDGGPARADFLAIARRMPPRYRGFSLSRLRYAYLNLRYMARPDRRKG
ncbi:MAG: hypothetical protein AAF216_10130 [Pseudomonadota bacterium]